MSETIDARRAGRHLHPDRSVLAESGDFRRLATDEDRVQATTDGDGVDFPHGSVGPVRGRDRPGTEVPQGSVHRTATQLRHARRTTKTRHYYQEFTII